MRSFVNWTGGARPGRAGSVMGILFLVAIIAIIAVLRMLATSETREKRKGLMKAWEDPQTMVDRFYVELRKEQKFKEKGWEGLMEFMSKDDVDWFNTNIEDLARTANSLEGFASAIVTERERKFAAMDGMLGIKDTSRLLQPTVSQVHTQGDRGAVFIHQPNNINSMMILFVCKEGDYWRIRRWLGKRDDYNIMKMLYEQHEFANIPLTDDEIMFKNDPQNYPVKKHNELMQECGLEPDQKLVAPEPNPTPTPTPDPNAPTPEPTPAQ